MVNSILKVSIIMPVYSVAKTIEKAVNSVVSQSYSNWELIIINDKCPENSCKAIESIINTDTRIIKIENNYNIGVSASRNKGIDYATGDIIAFLDSDDCWLDDKLSKQIAEISAGYDVVCSNYIRVYNDGRQSTVGHKEIFTYSDMLKSNQIGNLTGIYNSKKLGKIYQKNVDHEDYVMWLEVMKAAGEGYCMQESLACYRVSSSSISANKLRAAIWQWKIYRSTLNLGLIKSIWLFTNYLYYACKKRVKAT